MTLLCLNSYDDIVANVIDKIADEAKVQVMVACHNEESINRAIAAMESKTIHPQSGKVTFGQVFGLSDHITHWLGKHEHSIVDLCGNFTGRDSLRSSLSETAGFL